MRLMLVAAIILIFDLMQQRFDIIISQQVRQSLMLGIGQSGTAERVDHAEQHEDLGGLVEQDREQVQGAEVVLVGPVEEKVGGQVID